MNGVYGTNGDGWLELVAAAAIRMTDLMSERIKRGVENALDGLTPTNPMHIHLDELVPDLGVASLVVLPKVREPYRR